MRHLSQIVKPRQIIFEDIACRRSKTPGEWLTSGLRVRRDDGGGFQAHLRVSWWGPGCVPAGEILGPECEGGTVPVEESTWGAIKALYD